MELLVDKTYRPMSQHRWEKLRSKVEVQSKSRMTLIINM